MDKLQNIKKTNKGTYSGSKIGDHSTLKLIWTNHRSKLLVLLIVEQKLFVERKLEISVSLA